MAASMNRACSMLVEKIAKPRPVRHGVRGEGSRRDGQCRDARRVIAGCVSPILAETFEDAIRRAEGKSCRSKPARLR